VQVADIGNIGLYRSLFGWVHRLQVIGWNGVFSLLGENDLLRRTVRGASPEVSLL